VAVAVRALTLGEALRGLEPRPGGRLVAVLGYSDRRAPGLHPICAARVARAAAEAAGADVVLLSGWARRRGASSEAALMLDAWTGPEVPLVCDHGARTTAENVAHVVALARALQVGEVVVVTSRWHEARTSVFLRRLLGEADVRVAVVPSGEPGGLRFVLREVVRRPLVPVQVLLLSRSRPTAPGRDASADVV
jgi:uncharacterized SAM-binding protein YcdF (DUF218 family)